MARDQLFKECARAAIKQIATDVNQEIHKTEKLLDSEDFRKPKIGAFNGFKTNLSKMIEEAGKLKIEVTEIIDGSPAQQAGLKVGDFVFSNIANKRAAIIDIRNNGLISNNNIDGILRGGSEVNLSANYTNSAEIMKRSEANSSYSKCVDTDYNNEFFQHLDRSLQVLEASLLLLAVLLFMVLSGAN